MEAFRIWTGLEIKGNAIREMKKFAEFTSITNKHLKILSKEMTALNQRFFILDNRLSRLMPHSEKLLSTFKGLGASANLNNRAFERYNAQLVRNNSSTAMLSERTSSLAERTILLADGIKSVSLQANLASGALLRMGAASRLNRVTGIGGGISRGGSHYRHVPYHALSHAGLGEIGSRASALGAAGRFGGPLLIGALGAGMALHSGYEKNVEYTKELSQFKALGFSDDQLKEVESFTSGVMPGVSSLRQIKALRDAQMATRKFSDAKILAPSLAKFQFIADSMFSGISDTGLQNAIRIAEFRGGADPQKIKDELTTVAQMYTTSGGTIDPTKFLPFFTGYQGANKLSREALLALEPTLQEYKPVKAATALQTLYGRMHGGVKLSEKDLDFFESIGLFKNGKIVKKYSSDLDKDPEAFFEKDWIPMLARHGIVTPEGISQANMHLGRTPSQFFSALGKNTEKAARARQQASGLLGLDDLMKTAFKTESGAALRFMQALESLVKAIGKVSSPLVTTALNSMAFLMERMAQIFSSDTQRADIDKAVGVKTTPFNWNDVPAWWHHFTKSPVSVSQIQQNKAPNLVVHMDGQKVGKIISQHQATSMNRGGTQSGPSGVNPMMTPQPAGINNFGGFN